MKEMTGDSYEASPYMKALCASEAKVGKTTFLVASVLGVLPWQKFGGIVDSPENLHVITFDASALGGIKRFIAESCGAKKEALGFKVYNLEDDMRRVAETDSDYNMAFYTTVLDTISKIGEKARGVPVVVVSSLTGLAAGVERSVVGPPSGKGYSDAAKWKTLAHQLHEIQNYAQIDKWHCFWEGHIDKPAGLGLKNEAPPKETIRVSGEAGRNWGYNVSHIFRIRRLFGQLQPGTKIDQVYLDTRPSLDFVASGRGVTEALDPKEPDMTVVLGKLGLKVGHWGRRK